MITVPWRLFVLVIVLFVHFNPGRTFSATPAHRGDFRDAIFAYRSGLEQVQNEGSSSCGIVWTIATATGVDADLSKLETASRGVGYHRLMSVAYEVLQAAGRVRHALQLNHTLPAFCGKKLELRLYIDRILIEGVAYKGITTLSTAARCVFDSIVYFDQLPLHKLPWSTVGNISDSTKRLSSRTNILKLVALISSPFAYTLYLDGDVAPCPLFPCDAFQLLAGSDMFTTANPFGYQSTNGQALYAGAPDHPRYGDYAEPNGGVIGYVWNARTERLLVRVLELIPYFHALGFDQDQAILRHAIFEETHLHGLRVNAQPMHRYCRFGWNCQRNSCRAGCVLIHQRICLANGLDHNYTVPVKDRARCGRVARDLWVGLTQHSRQYHLARKANGS